MGGFPGGFPLQPAAVPSQSGGGGSAAATAAAPDVSPAHVQLGQRAGSTLPLPLPAGMGGTPGGPAGSTPTLGLAAAAAAAATPSEGGVKIERNAAAPAAGGDAAALRPSAELPSMQALLGGAGGGGGVAAVRDLADLASPVSAALAATPPPLGESPMCAVPSLGLRHPASGALSLSLPSRLYSRVSADRSAVRHGPSDGASAALEEEEASMLRLPPSVEPSAARGRTAPRGADAGVAAAAAAAAAGIAGFAAPPRGAVPAAAEAMGGDDEGASFLGGGDEDYQSWLADVF